MRIPCETQETFEWDSIILDINQRRHIIGKRTLQEMYVKLVDILLSNVCEDKDVVARIAESLARVLAFTGRRSTRMSNVTMNEPDIHASDLSWILSPLRIRDESRVPSRDSYLFDVGQCVYISTGPASATGYRRSAKAVRLALSSCDWKYMNILVRTGLFNGQDSVGVEYLYATWFEFVLLLYPNELPKAVRYTLEVWMNLQANGGRMLSDARRGFWRIALIIRTLRAVALHHDERPEAENYLKCLNIYFTTLSDPEVSADEIREFLQYMMPGKDCSQGVGKWMELFGGGRQYAPRSLTHLCRRTVRSVLVQNMSDVLLPALVDRLPFPRRLKDFVLVTP